MIELRIETPDEMAALGRRIAAQLHAGDIVALDGALGAGKTTLTRGIGDGLAVRGAVTSPTFVLARTHPRPSGGAPLVHVDAYRLGSAAELDDLDIDFAASITVVEWAAGMLDGLDESVLRIAIERPTGAGAGSAAAGATDGTRVEDGAGVEDGTGAEVEPRIVRLDPIGPRWVQHPFV